jgi:protein O-GlcNAc transferase
MTETVKTLFGRAIGLHQSGRTADAEAIYRYIWSLDPGHLDTIHLLGVAAYQTGKLDLAAQMIGRAICLKNDETAFFSNLGNVFKDLGRTAEAVVNYRRALFLRPAYAEAHSNLGNALQELADVGEAIRSLRKALILNPGYAEAWNNLGNAIFDLGEHDDANRFYLRALQVNPDYLDALDNHGFLQLYRPGVTLAEIQRQARRQAGSKKSAAGQVRALPAEHAKPRIGFVSGDFRLHPVGFLVIPALEGLSRAGWDVTCYSNCPQTDELTTRFRKLARRWRPIAGLPDEAVDRQIRDDGIDILIDLSGRSAYNRLPLFMARPAPIQAAWAVGYPATTGLDAMDFLIADRFQVPDGSERFYSEKILRLPDSYICFEPPPDAPPLGELPVLATGKLTFGSFNVLKKISPPTIALWGALLRRLPEASLLMKTLALGSDDVRRYVQNKFAAQGISPDRLRLVGRTSRAEHNAYMAQTDIALDSWPYSGGMTTLEALWMGLPVISLAGDRFCSRHSLGYLSNIGLSELVAESPDHYLDLVAGFAEDIPRLASLRAGMRQRILSSPLCDSERFVRHFEAALMAMSRHVRAPAASGSPIPTV